MLTVAYSENQSECSEIPKHVKIHEWKRFINAGLSSAEQMHFQHPQIAIVYFFFFCTPSFLFFSFLPSPSHTFIYLYFLLYVYVFVENQVSLFWWCFKHASIYLPLPTPFRLIDPRRVFSCTCRPARLFGYSWKMFIPELTRRLWSVQQWWIPDGNYSSVCSRKVETGLLISRDALIKIYFLKLLV